jgi:hypothetical protein
MVPNITIESDQHRAKAKIQRVNTTQDAFRGPASRRRRLKGLLGMAAGGDRTVSSRKMVLKMSRFALLIQR